MRSSKNNPGILPVQSTELPQIAELWEASVRATHDFLSEEDILFFRSFVENDYLPSANLYCVRENGAPVAFVGICNKEIETLFVHPDARGKGYGKHLLEFAVNELGADRVDVNEQNEQAVGFYRRMGFKVVGRDETDGYGKPFPILHMERLTITERSFGFIPPSGDFL